MKILFEDEEIIVCVKPRNVLSQYDEKRINMIGLLSEHSETEIYPVHRLDKETGGVMVFAKTRTAAAVLSSEIAKGEMKKRYLAVAKFDEEHTKGCMEDLIYFDRQKNKAFTVKKERRGVKKASLSYECIGLAGERALYEIELHTGRTHQIRVQFSSRKMPLYGDRKYGGEKGEVLALWAYRLSFDHPKTRERMTFSLMPEENIFATVEHPGMNKVGR